jgi:hypothetical protein
MHMCSRITRRGYLTINAICQTLRETKFCVTKICKRAMLPLSSVKANIMRKHIQTEFHVPRYIHLMNLLAI